MRFIMIRYLDDRMIDRHFNLYALGTICKAD
jgi:hypothetical protein